MVLVGTAVSPVGSKVGALVNTATVGTLVDKAPLEGALEGAPVGRAEGAVCSVVGCTVGTKVVRQSADVGPLQVGHELSQNWQPLN